MKIPSLLLLSVVSLQMGCNACTSKPVTPKPAEPTPPGPANNNVIPSKSTVTAVFFTAKDKTMFWMESTGSTYGAPPEKSYWTDQGVIVPQNDGWHTYLADGSNFATAVAPDPAAGLISIKDVLLKETTAPEGYTWESEASAGPIRIFINPAMGKRQRIGAYPEPPSAPVWMEAKRPEARGAEVPMLSKSSGFQLREDSKAYKNEPPLGSTAIASAAASAEDLAGWTAGLTAIRGGATTIDLSQMLDLNADGVAEGFVCVTGGLGSPCYIVDKVGEETRFYTTTIQWTAGNPELPQFFSTDKGSYITHSPKDSISTRGNGIIRIVRFDGSGYATESIQ